MKRKKRALTLLEIMIVILLIGVIGSVVGYSVKGSLDKGRRFRTEQGKERLKDIVSLAEAAGQGITQKISRGLTISAAVLECVQESGLAAKDPAAMMKDGWGEDYTITWQNGELTIVSRHDAPGG